MTLRIFRHQYNFPVTEEPQWKSLVDRWYQLDAASFGLVEAFSKNSGELENKPSLMLLASPGSSNETDFNFVETGAASPAKFVHTLPSVRGTPFLQVTSWKGPLLCLQKDPETFLSGLEEALEMLSSDIPRIWLLSSEQKHQESGLYTAVIAELSLDGTGSCKIHCDAGKSAHNATDLEFWKWWNEPHSAVDFSLKNRYRLVK